MSGFQRRPHRLFAWAGRFLLMLVISGCAGTGMDVAALDSASSPREDGGLGGTGHENSVNWGRWAYETEEGGIGGTGRSDDGGLGGTGQVAALGDPEEGGLGGTGIIGAITGFGSIVVNGVHIDYDPATPVSTLLGDAPTSAANLRIGHVVEVEAFPRGSRYLAKRIRLKHLLAGAMQSQAPGMLRVAGQTVLLNAETRLPEGGLSPGQRLLISGLWDGVNIHASRVERYAGEQDLLVGRVREDNHGSLKIGAVSLDSADESLQQGPELILRGAWSPSGFRTTEVKTRPRLPFDGRVAGLLVEGYPEADGQGLQMEGVRLEGDRPQPGERQVVKGDLRQGPASENAILEIRQTQGMQGLEQGMPQPPMGPGRADTAPPLGGMQPDSAPTPRAGGNPMASPPPTQLRTPPTIRQDLGPAPLDLTTPGPSGIQLGPIQRDQTRPDPMGGLPARPNLNQSPMRPSGLGPGPSRGSIRP